MSDWRDESACLEADPELFFHPDNERGADRRKREAAAKAVCGSCPVANECRAAADEGGERYGVWGGLGEDERAEIAVAMRRNNRRERRLAGRPAEAPDRPVMVAAEPLGRALQHLVGNRLTGPGRFTTKAIADQTGLTEGTVYEIAKGTRKHVRQDYADAINHFLHQLENETQAVSA